MDNVQDTQATAPLQGQTATPQEQAPSTQNVETQNGANGAIQNQTQANGESGSSEAFQMPDKFKGKSAEDIAQAYVNLEKHKTKVEMERAELEKLFLGEQPQPSQINQAEYQNQAQGAPIEDPLKPVVDALTPHLTDQFNRLLAPLATRFEIKEMVDKYGDSYITVAPQVAELKKQNPSLSQEAAYKIVAFDNLQRTARNQGIQEATKTQELQRKAQVESSRPSGFKPETLAEAVGNKNISTLEIAKALAAEDPRFNAFVEKLGK